ncbi:hypothetical protein LLEC1_06007 [Akanthomyces lecanii]|uniref:Uncharacterized protein n=1 Tax=Cordyceps confragosa TaxID=2714763 RepID=A0A179IEW3_CORDF|nr:hypothetical protein LLEC1_06007 [Akanthomyces lecanii]
MAAREKVYAGPGFALAKKDDKTSAGLVCFAVLLDNLLRFTQPLATQLPDRKHPEVPVTLSTDIIDLSGISVLQFWSLRNHIRTLACLVLAASSSWARRPFSVQCLAGSRAGWTQLLCPRFAYSAPAKHVRSIPKAYSGELDYAFGEAPVLDSTLRILSIGKMGTHLSC